MKTAGRENPNHDKAILSRNRAHGAVGQNRSRSIKWAAKQEKLQPKEMRFFLTSPFIEQPGVWERQDEIARASQSRVITNCVAAFGLDQGSGVTLKPWCSMFPFRGQAEMIAVRHLHFRETMVVNDLVLFDNAILVEDKGGQSVDLIGF